MLRKFCLLLGLIFTLFYSTQAFSNLVVSPSQIAAKKLLEKISGSKVPISDPLIDRMAEQINKGNWSEAARIATEHPNFLNITVKQMALKMSTREETIAQKLNDFTASFIGITRDETDARELLTGNFHYKADLTKLPNGVTVRSGILNDIVNSNNHYSDLDNVKIDIGQVLTRINGQPMRNLSSITTPTDADVQMNPDPAGVLTSRAFMISHANAGTNRRLVEYSLREFTCLPIQSWADVTQSDARIGRDIDRFPGGDHQKFLTTCKGCHTIMDGFRGAFAKWDASSNNIFHSSLKNGGSFDSKGVGNKMNKNNTVFPDGYVMINDSFINNAKAPTNMSQFGWRETQSGGNGVHDFGVLVSNSKRFSQCMVKRTFEAVCRKQISIESDFSFVDGLATNFEQSNYNLKKLFQQVSISKECQ